MERTIAIHRIRFFDIADGEYLDPVTDTEMVAISPECDDETPVSIAVVTLRSLGLVEVSSSHYHYGVWYSLPDGSNIISYRTGEREAVSAHLNGFTDAEERAIFTQIAK